MKLAATVIIPTHDHCQLLNYSIPSVLSQTVQDIEILIIGDGVPDGTRKIVADFMQQDKRIKFFDFPKGARLGEAYRHEVITQHAKGEIICYHSDDDLMMPHHVAILQDALKHADFAHTLPVIVLPDNSLDILPVNLGIADFYNIILTENNRIPMSNAAHTLQFYRTLPFGWRTTPVGAATDHYMWQQILSQPACRAVTVPHPSVIGFPSSYRRDWTIADRLEELNNWQKDLTSADNYVNLLRKVQEACLAKVLTNELRYRKNEMDLRREMGEIQHDIKIMKNTITWRFREKLLPLLKTLRRKKHHA